MSLRISAVLAVLLGVVFVDASRAGNLTSGMKRGSVDLKSAGPAAFAPEGVLLVGDTVGAALVAIATDDKPTGSASAGAGVRVERIDEKIAALLGATPKEVVINDLAVNPETGNVFLTVSRGRGPEAKPLIFRIDSSGSITELALSDVLFSKAPFSAAPEGKQRQDVITDLMFTGGKVLVAGLSNEEFASRLRSVDFPFAGVNPGVGVEIYHGAHGKYETKAPIRTFTLFEIGGEPTVLAAYTCTPLVKIPVSALSSGSKVKGVTVAELGNHNRPLDIVPYKKDGKDYLLISNTSRGLIKVDLANVESEQGITQRIKETAGLPYETIKDLAKIEQLDRLDKDRAILLARSDAGALNLIAVDLP